MDATFPAADGHSDRPCRDEQVPDPPDSYEPPAATRLGGFGELTAGSAMANKSDDGTYFV